MTEINTEFIKKIMERRPKEISLVDFITDILPISKEAAYRRIRGEILFTLDETITICTMLDISLDNLVKYVNGNRYVFSSIPMNVTDPMEWYCKILENITFSMLKIQSGNNCFSLVAPKTLSAHFALKFDQISRLKVVKWIYKSNPSLFKNKMESLIIPLKVRKLEKEFMNLIQHIPASIILDDMTIHHFANDIKFFVDLGVISDDELEEIKKECLEMMDDIERASILGVFDSGTKTNIYSSHTFFDATYRYTQNDEFRFCTISYGLNYLKSEDDFICNNQRLWIESLIRYSTLISNTGEIVRVQFLKKQRDIINLL